MNDSNKVVITPERSSFSSKVLEIWQYRELLWMLAWRDFRVRYAQTFLGISWAIINPLFTLLVLSFVFGIVAKVDTGGIPHILYTLAGLCGWTFFASLATDAGRSVLLAQGLVKKIYFPRLILPLSSIFTSLIDFGIVLFCLVVLMFIYQYTPTLNIIWLPFFTFLAIMAGVASGIWASALTIRFRDFNHVMPLVMRVGMYATPIAYSASQVPEKYQVFFFLNPMAGVVEGMRWSLLGTPDFPPFIWLSSGIIVLLFISGWFYFSRIEHIIADII